ncbi:tetratricopeptide repeat-containing S1 family peptidase, partial [Crocosphaera watsonii]
MNSPLLPTILLGTIATVTLIQPVAVSLSPTEINDKAKQFIVKIDGSDAAPKGNGSGSIIGRNGNNYQVLTNWHVVSESDNFNDYKIQTSDGTIHAVTQIKRLNGADLAIINFSSSNSYSVAKLGDSRNLTEGQTIHFSGYPAQKPRSYLFYPNQNINGFIPTASAEDGYEIIFTGAIVPGMSGSPLLNENGEIIGIYGRGGFGGPLYSIRVNTAISLAQQQGLNIASGSPSPPSNLTTTPITREPQLTAVEWFNKGEDLGKNEDYLEAINAFTQAIRLNPNYNIFYYNRGVAYNKLGNYQRAIEDHNQAIRLDPN